MLWNVTPKAGSRIRFTDRSCAILMKCLLQFNGKLLNSEVVGHENNPTTSKFFKVMIELPSDKKQEFETMSGFLLKYPQDKELVG